MRATGHRRVVISMGGPGAPGGMDEELHRAAREPPPCRDVPYESPVRDRTHRPRGPPRDDVTTAAQWSPGLGEPDDDEREVEAWHTARSLLALLPDGRVGGRASSSAASPAASPAPAAVPPPAGDVVIDLRDGVTPVMRPRTPPTGVLLRPPLPAFDRLDDVLAYTPQALTRARSGRTRHIRRGLADVEDSEQPFLPRVGAVGPLPAEPLSLRHVNWRPRLGAFVVAFLVVLVYSVWSFEPNRTPLGWVLSVVWSMPVVGTLIGLQGALMLRRGLKVPLASTPTSGVRQDMLVVVVPTIGRHDTYPALERVVRSFVEHLPDFFPRLRTDVVVEDGCEAEARIRTLAAMHPSIRVVTVPRAYTTPNGTRFKARANHYAHELRLRDGEARDDVWVLHMDDDTAVGPDTAASVAQFLNAQRAAGPDAKHLAQGILTYPRENAVNWLTWMADAVRPADDIARFRAVTGSGTPVAGLHGELLLVRASIEADIGWDFGPKALVEDAQFALVFAGRHPGRSAWFNGRCFGASPATLRDFVRQRERWAWGLVSLSLNRSVPLRHRWFMGWSVLTWVLGPLQHLGVVLVVAALLGTDSTSPVTETVVVLWALNFAYVVWGYWEGLRLNRLASRAQRRRWYEPVLVVLLLPFFAFVEGVGGLRGLLKWATRRENQFVVIAKPA